MTRTRQWRGGGKWGDAAIAFSFALSLALRGCLRESHKQTKGEVPRGWVERRPSTGSGERLLRIHVTEPSYWSTNAITKRLGPLMFRRSEGEGPSGSDGKRRATRTAVSGASGTPRKMDPVTR
jgi:hypothetical protein